MIGITNSNTSTIYVGPTEPTSGVRIWLDTDEEGASAVNSVNGKAGTVVLDLDDICFATLLWTNASETSSFATQTIQIDLTDYDWISMVIRHRTSEATYYTIFCPKGIKTAATMLSGEGTGIGRDFTPSDSGVLCGTGTKPGTAWDDTRMIPVAIYGIKGVQTS